MLGSTSIVAPVKVDAFSRVLLAHLHIALANFHVIKKRASFLNPFSPLLDSNFLLSSKFSDQEGKNTIPIVIFTSSDAQNTFERAAFPCFGVLVLSSTLFSRSHPYPWLALQSIQPTLLILLLSSSSKIPEGRSTRKLPVHFGTGFP